MFNLVDSKGLKLEIKSIDHNGVTNIAHATGKDKNMALKTAYLSKEGEPYKQILDAQGGSLSPSIDDAAASIDLPARTSALLGDNNNIAQASNIVNGKISMSGKLRMKSGRALLD